MIYYEDEEKLFRSNDIHDQLSEVRGFSDFYYQNFNWNLYSSPYYPYSLECE